MAYPPLPLTTSADPSPFAHLASFGRSAIIKVPYICHEMFNGSLETYPERRGWDTQKLYKGDLEGHTVEEAGAFLQEWLFFGPLFHVLNTDRLAFDSQDFMHQDENGAKWVTTEKLADYMKRWYFRPQFGHQGGRTEDQKRQLYNHVYSGLKTIHRYVLRFCGKDSNAGKYYPPMKVWPLTPELALSISALCDSLTKAGFEATGLNFNLDWGRSSLLESRMKELGWCPNVVSTLTTTQQVHLLYSAQTLGQPYASKDHTNCTDMTCKVDQIVESTYKTEDIGDCKCRLKGPDIDDLIAIIKTGGIPLIEVHEKDNDVQVRIRSVEQSAEKGYVAISHVWGDGLGNPLKNTLPICQLLRIQKAVDSLAETPVSSPSAWWCDTLCVPVEEPHVEWRKAAIRNMRDVYANSAKVLVFDKGLMPVSTSATILEIYLRLKLSSWMRRLWTFQEGVFAKRIAFQLRDGVIYIGQVYNQMLQTEHDSRRFIYARYSFDSQAVLGTFLRGGDNPQFRNLENYSKLLMWRSSSKQADEVLCLMTMLKMSNETIKNLLKLEDEDYAGKMVHLYKNLSAIPKSTLFQPPPRLKVPGFRWAPQSFLSSFRGTRSEPFRAIPGTGRIDPSGSGLLLKSSGLRLHDLQSGDSLPEIGKSFLLQPNTENAAQLLVSYPGAPTDSGTDWVAKNPEGTTRLMRPAIILGQDLFSLDIVDGALVDVYGEPSPEGDGRIVCHYIAWVGIVNAVRSGHLVEGLNTVHAVHGELVAPEQEWLVM